MPGNFMLTRVSPVGGRGGVLDGFSYWMGDLSECDCCEMGDHSEYIFPLEVFRGIP